MPSIEELEQERDELGDEIVAFTEDLETDLPAAPDEDARNALAAELEEMLFRFRQLDFAIRTATAGLVWDYDASSLDLTPIVGTQDITFTRASDGAYVDSAGLSAIAASNVPRFDYDTGTLALRGILFESFVTNRMPRSNDFDLAAWTKTDTVVTANATAAPSGTVTADLLTEGSAGTASVGASRSLGAGIGTTRSVHISRNIKRGNHDWILLEVSSDAGANGFRVWFNVNTGAVGQSAAFGTGTFSAAYVFPRANGFFRCYAVGCVAVGAVTAVHNSQSASADGSTTRVNGATRYEWNGQLTDPTRRLLTPRRDVTTAAAIVTTATDAASAPASSAPGFDENSFTILFEGELGIPAEPDDRPRYFAIDDGTLGAGVYIEQADGPDVGLKFVVADEDDSSRNVVGSIVNSAGLAAGSVFRAAVSVSRLGVVACAANGVGGTYPEPLAQMPVRALTTLRLAGLATGSSPQLPCSPARRYQVYSPALALDAILALTEPTP